MNNLGSEALQDLIELTDHWLMSRAERGYLEALLMHVKPQASIEIGTAYGKSLNLISRYSQHTWSLDLDFSKILPDQRKRLEATTTFVQGDSKLNIYSSYNEANRMGLLVEFILIDGDHSPEGVRGDIEEVLKIKSPIRPIHILMHDSFNPRCRAGIMQASWDQNPHVHVLELDQVPGKLSFDGMWGGFAYALLLPEPRKNQLKISSSDNRTFRAALAASLPHLISEWTKEKVKSVLKRS